MFRLKGMTIDVIRGNIDVEKISSAFERTKMDVPKAPSAGLYLAKVNYLDIFQNLIIF